MQMLWQELFKPACARDFKIEVSGSSLVPANTNINNESQAEKYPVRDRERDSFNDTLLLEMDDFGVGDAAKGGIVIKAIKLDKPYNNTGEIFENITQLVKVLHSFFQNNVSSIVIKILLNFIIINDLKNISE